MIKIEEKILERETLIRLLCESTLKSEICSKETHEDCRTAKGDCAFCAITADYLIANGIIVPPCKVGQTVWFIRNGKIVETEVEKIILKSKGLYLKLGCNAMYETSCNSISKTVFLTREEAEKALAERQNNCMIAQYVEDCEDCGFCQK